MPEFEWDENKNDSNKQKHKISFEEAKEVFEDKERIQYIANKREYGEKRWKTVGSILGVVITVVYTVRERVFRIISARRSNKKERKDYLDSTNRNQ